jgi:hypothetical protein
MSAVRATLGADAFDAAFQAGARLNLDEAIDMALTAQ